MQPESRTWSRLRRSVRRYSSVSTGRFRRPRGETPRGLKPASQATPSRSVVTAAVVLFIAAWGVPQLFHYNRPWLIGDIKIYAQYGNLTIAHEVPYRDFSVEYPPGALPVFVGPILARKWVGYHGFFATWFRILIAICGSVAILGMALCLRALRAPPERFRAALVFAALAPVLLGVIISTRYDYWPAMLTVLALAALLWERDTLAFAALAAGAAAKIYPAVLLPIATVDVARRRGWRHVGLCLAVFTAVLAAAFLPFFALAPHGLWRSFYTQQASRPLEIESLPAGLLLVLKQLVGLRLHHVTSHGSDNLVGSAPRALAGVDALLQLAALVAVWTIYARGHGGKERLVLASAAAVTAFIAFDKVFSPQYLVWLMVLVPLVRGRSGLVASAILTVMLALTQAYYPWLFDNLTHHWDPLASWLIFVRNVLVLALLAVLVRPLILDRGSPKPVPAG
jgi:hypothetical protein